MLSPTQKTNKSDEELRTYLCKSLESNSLPANAPLNQRSYRNHFTGVSFAGGKPIKFQLAGKAESDLRKITSVNTKQFYSRTAILAFSIVFTVIFGAVLLSNNLKGNPKAQKRVVWFGIIYTLLSVFVLSKIQPGTFSTLILNGVGAILMTSIFWNRYIGKEIKYQPKPILKPLLISIGISLFFLIVGLYIRE